MSTPRPRREPLDLAVELERAVERNEFGLEYQPIIDLANGVVAGVEALLRWRHPLMGTIAPGDYLPIAERTGLIVPIGRRVLETSARQLRTWHLGFARMQSLALHVNVSPAELAQPDFVGWVAETLKAASVPLGALTVELGPGAADHAPVCTALRDLGVDLALEDFGIGDSMEQLKLLPYTQVKLHPSVTGLTDGAREEVDLAGSLIGVARMRRLVTIGKGVETRDQARRLAAIGCDLGQGFLYSKPLGPEGIGTLLARGRVPVAGFN